MELVDFFRTVITGGEGWFCLAYCKQGDKNHPWREEFFSYPDDLPIILNRIETLGKEFDIYFSPYLFREQSSIKTSAIPGKTIVADLDEASIVTLNLPPNVLVETSPDRHQGYWILDEQIDKDEHELLSKRLTYSIPRCDLSGWFLGKKVRVPTTYNHKYKSGPKYIRIADFNLRNYTAASIETLVEISNDVNGKAEYINGDLSWVNMAMSYDINPQEMLAKIRNLIPAKLYSSYNTEALDRSTALWALTTALFRAGLNKEHVYYIAYNSPNNKFLDLKNGGINELAKDVLRAEVSVKAKVPDIKGRIEDARLLPGSQIKKSAYVKNMIAEHMNQLGKFIHADDGTAWFIRDDTGKPIQITTRSESLETMMSSLYGINSSEREFMYVTKALMADVLEGPVSGKIGSLSTYDHDNKVFLLHTGRKDVLKVTRNEVSRINNGASGVLFPWSIRSSTISPKHDENVKWDNVLLDGCLDNITDVTKEQAQAILKVWFITLLLRDGLVARPILALFGQPGCIAGSTPLSIRRGEHSARYYTIAHLYNESCGNWNKSIHNRIRSVKDGIIKWRKIHKVIMSGIKLTYNIKIEGRKPFRTTRDHLFLTPEGYKKLHELNIGDRVVVEGGHVTGNGQSVSWRPEVNVKYHPHGRERMVGIFGPYKSIYRYRAVVEARLNGLSTEQFIRIVNNNKEAAEKLTYLDADIVIHHKDGNPLNDDFNNLEVKTKLEHDKHHGIDKVRNFGSWSGMNYTTTAVIESITEYKVEPTFDIQMEDEDAQNFLINGVVVHNSGKSTLFRRIYALMYGRGRAINAVTREDDFDYASAVDPLVVLDNVDTFAKWLPDRLALSASTSEIVRRKLYTDNDVVIIRRQAMVGITAHNPKFGREDVVDRLLLLNFERLQHFAPETEIINKIVSMRNVLWGSILDEIRIVLNTPIPTSGYPQFRVEDFARYGYWIAKALGIDKHFYDGLENIRNSQKSFVIDEEGMVIDAIIKFTEQKTRGENKWTEYYSASQLWVQLQGFSSDANAFTKRYSNAVSLGRKLWILQDVMRQVLDIDVQFDTIKRVRKWAFAKLEVSNEKATSNGKVSG